METNSDVVTFANLEDSVKEEVIDYGNLEKFKLAAIEPTEGLAMDFRKDRTSPSSPHLRNGRRLSRGRNNAKPIASALFAPLGKEKNFENVFRKEISQSTSNDSFNSPSLSCQSSSPILSLYAIEKEDEKKEGIVNVTFDCLIRKDRMKEAFNVAEMPKEVHYKSFYRRICHEWPQLNYIVTTTDMKMIVTVMFRWDNLMYPCNKERDIVYYIVKTRSGTTKIYQQSFEDIMGNPEKSRKRVDKQLRILFPNSDIAPLNIEDIEDKLLDLNDLSHPTKFTFGVIYAKEDVLVDNDSAYFSNKEGSPQFDDFLQLIGTKVRLQGFERFAGGLDTKKNTTGQYSIHDRFRDAEIMYHVSTLLPSNDEDQIETKRYIGNNVVTIVFLDEKANQFSSKWLESKFLQIYIIVKKIQDKYMVNMIKHSFVPDFGPPFPNPPIFAAEELGLFLKEKMINGQLAAYKNPLCAAIFLNPHQSIFDEIVNEYFFKKDEIRKNEVKKRKQHSSSLTSKPSFSSSISPSKSRSHLMRSGISPDSHPHSNLLNADSGKKRTGIN